MPPKASSRDAKTKTKKPSAQQQAVTQATNDAQKLFKHHDQLRTVDERADKVVRDITHLDAAVEKQRLSKEREFIRSIHRDNVEAELLALKEHDKHLHWKHIPDASRLPNVHRESEINTFLSVWSDTQEHYNKHQESIVIASKGQTGDVGHHLSFQRGEQGVSPSKRQAIVDDELRSCLQAYELTKAIAAERDRSVCANAKEQTAFHDRCLVQVFSHILRSLDFITVHSLLYYDVVIDEHDGEMLVKMKPEENPVLKYGLWVKVKEVTRSFAALVFSQADIRLDPKSNTLPKLPKALGLSKENIAVRVVQLSFDPYSGYSVHGKEFYALSCTLKVDLLTFAHRPKEVGKWLLREETVEAHKLHYEEYPPHKTEARMEDPAFRISFDVPLTVVIRQPSLLIGKWVDSRQEWEPCAHTTFGVQFVGATQADTNHRRATFVTSDLAQFAVLQEKGFDVPYERWSLQPLSDDRVVLSLEGRRHGEASDREFRVLIEDAYCKLLGPDDPEFVELRNGWLEPVTLFRLLSQAGFNFVLVDADAQYLENVIPKSAALEKRAYADIAQFCQFFTFSSSRHNKYGEDPDMALFRVSKKYRDPETEVEPIMTSVGDDSWYSVRYHTSKCVLCAFGDAEKEADLNILTGQETHYDLHTLLLPLVGEDDLNRQISSTNYLLRRCVLQLLTLIRPLSWG